MKNLKSLFILLFLSVGSFSYLVAQESKDAAQTRSFDREITVEKEYKPLIREAKKINVFPYFLELRDPQIAARYTLNFSKPLRFEQGIFHLSEAKLQPHGKYIKEGFARVGVGTGVNTLADFVFPLLKKKKTRLDFIAHHYGLFNSKAHTISEATLDFSQLFESAKLYAGISGGYETFDYYGDFFSSTGTNLAPDFSGIAKNNALGRLKSHIGFQQRIESDTDLQYKVQLDYNMLNAATGVFEQQFSFNSNVEFSLFDGRFGVDAFLTGLVYKSKVGSLGDQFKNYSVLSLNPYYTLSKPKWDLRLGINMALPFVAGKKPNITPDVEFEYKLFPEFVALYVGAGGEYKINSLNAIYNENCFVAPNVRVGDSGDLIKFFAGTKIKPFAGLLIDFYGDYRHIKNQYFFVNVERESETDPFLVYTNNFKALDSKAVQARVGAKLSYSYYNRFSVQLHGAYNYWNVEKYNRAWHKPNWNVDLTTSARITTKINVYMNLYANGARYAKIGEGERELKPSFDLNIGGNYALYDWLSVFLRVNNVLHNRYEQWNGYKVQGFNVMAGASFNF